LQVPGAADRAAEDLQGAPLLDPLGEGVQGKRTAVLRIRTRIRIRDPYVLGLLDRNPSITIKKSKENLDFYCFMNSF
jgi:hypothetical protein